MTTRAGFRFGPARVAVETDDRDVSRWLTEFVTPWFEGCAAHPGDRVVRFTASRAAFAAAQRQCAAATTRPLACFSLDREVATLPGWTDGGATFAADTEMGSFYRVSAAGVEVLARPEYSRARIGLMRVVREILVGGRRAVQRLLDLHAAAFATPGGAILLAGPKQAGKTTLLTHALQSGRASLIANDRVLVDVEPGSPAVIGVPTVVSVRAGTLELFPWLRRAQDERPALLHGAETAASAIAVPPGAAPSREFGLSLAQLAQRCGSATTRRAPAAAIVFPEIDLASRGWSLEPLAGEAGTLRLLDSRYGIRGMPRPPTIFDEPASRGEPQGESTHTQIARLAAAVPLFRCRLGPGAYRDGAGALLAALTGEPLPAAPAQ